MTKLEELYELLMHLTAKDNKDDYDYLRYIVTHCERDYMFMLMNQLKELYKDNKGDDK